MDPRHVIRYERSRRCRWPGAVRLLGYSHIQRSALSSGNDNILYDKATIDTLLKALLEAGGALDALLPPSRLRAGGGQYPPASMK